MAYDLLEGYKPNNIQQSDNEEYNLLEGFKPTHVSNQTSDSFSPDNINFTDPVKNPWLDKTKNLLQGGVNYAQNALTDFSNHAVGYNENLPNQRPTVAQGLGNLTHDFSEFGKGIVTGVPDFINSIKMQAATTGENLKENPSNWKDVLPAVGHGIDQALADILGGAVNLPEAIAASYMGREYNPHVQFVKPVEGNYDLFTELLYNKGIISPEQYAGYLAHKEKRNQANERLPLATTIGEFIPGMIPVGRAAGLFGTTAKTTQNLSKAQKVAQMSKDIAKAGGVGAGYGFVANPEGNLAERSQSAGAGLVAGASLGAAGKGVKAGANVAAPHIHKAAKTTAYYTGKGARKVADVSARLNPKNYTTEIVSEPVNKGLGLSQRTVYETKVKRVYRPEQKNGYMAKEATGNNPRLTDSGNPKTDIQDIAPNIARKQAAKKFENAKNPLSTDVVKEPNWIFSKPAAKVNIDEDTKKKVSEIAPNIAEKQGLHTKDFTKGDIVRDIYTGEIYEIIEPDKRGMGYLRNVDTGDIRDLNAHNNAHFEKYEYDPNDLIDVEKFKYDEKDKRRNAENYMYSKQEVVDAYNEYVKNPTELNKEKYEDASGKALKEFHDNEEAIKNGTFNLIPENKRGDRSISLSDRLKQLGYDSVEVDKIYNELKEGKPTDLRFTHNWYNRLLNTGLESDFILAQKLNNLTKEYRNTRKEKAIQNDTLNVQAENNKKLNTKKTKQRNKKAKTDISARAKKAAAWDILSIATGKSKHWLKFRYRKSGELIENLLEKVDDKLTVAGVPEKYGHLFPELQRYMYENVTKDDTGWENEFVEKIYQDLLNNYDFNEETVGTKIETEINDYFEEIENAVNIVKEKIENAGEDAFYVYDKECNNLFNKYSKKIPEEIFNELLTLASDINEKALYNKNKEVSNEYKRSINENTSRNGQEISEYDTGNQSGNDGNNSSSRKSPSGKTIQTAEGLEDESVELPTNGVEKSDNIVNNINRDNKGVSEYAVREQEPVSSTNGTRRELSESETKNNEGSRTESGLDEFNGRDRRQNNISDGRRLTPEHKLRIEKNYKNQHELNSSIEEFINNKEYETYGTELPEELKTWLKKFTGAGGLEKQGAEGKGLLSEYYTPDNVVKKIWDLTSQYVKTDGAKVLEPSAGIGRFIEHAPKNTSFDAVEMNPISAKITELLYPNASVEVGEFQRRFINPENSTPVKSVNGTYDIVIGNPPYGQYTGRYKGLGEGKNFKRMESYFINRGLDSLKENGVMAFIVPSTFLKSPLDMGKTEIGKKAVLLDAYRLPENVFPTTSIGTDIIILRKSTGGKLEGNLNNDHWFEKNPDKILGEVAERKNRFGKFETYVKGNKDSIDNIDTSLSDIKETKEIVSEQPQKTIKKATISKTEKVDNKKSGNKYVDYERYKPQNPVSEEDYKYFVDTQVDGTLPDTKYKAGEKVNQFNGNLYNDFNYQQGNIYEKLDALEHEDISDKQKEIQRKKLMAVLPKPKTAEKIYLTPTSDFIQDLIIGQKENTHYGPNGSYKKFDDVSLKDLYVDYLETLSNTERNGISSWDIRSYINGNTVRINYKSSASDKEGRSIERIEYMTRLKNTVDKTFNDFVRNEISPEYRKKLEDAWNRQFNNTYNPDYSKMPMLVKDLNSKFNGKKLELQNVQVEGVNYLLNKGYGLLGFEVGVGKTLSGIISTVENMNMGRCKRPLVLIPKQVKNNWISEFKEAYPNIKVNDIDNLSNFNGKIEDGTVTLGTYEALGNIWYDKNEAAGLVDLIYNTGSKIKEDLTKRGTESAKERAEKVVGIAEKNNKKKFTVTDLGFDHITVDEAHNFRNLFRQAQADGKNNNPYTIGSGGDPSARAARLFLLVQNILKNNGNRNVFMLTATPFNNSPLEVFNMLSYLEKDKLDKMGLYNVFQFMENYADVDSDWVVNSRNDVVYNQITTGFKNADSLRALIQDCMLIRDAEQAGIVRPEAHTKKVILEPTEKQLELIRAAEEEALSSTEDGAVLKAINQSRKATLSPDIATKNYDVTPEEFVKNAPKIEYIMDAVETMKNADPDTSQLIYMPLGVEFLPKMKQYLVNKGVFKANEIEIIQSGISDDKLADITSSFNDRNGKVKLIIGTNKIKEGMNLNKNSSVLYVPFMDWNPTDYIQVKGRIWRRGNRYNKIRVVVPLLKNSSDSFMFQKLSEKTSRINNIMDPEKEYIDTEELNTAEEKLNMISLPEKRAAMYERIKEQELNFKITQLKGQLDTANKYKNALERVKRNINSYKEDIAEQKKSIENASSDYMKDYYMKRKEQAEKDLKDAKSELTRLENKIKRLELDFEGKDSEAAINHEIEKIQNQINDLKAESQAKLLEYQENYEKERASSKTIKELIKEFEQDTKDLYGEGEFSAELPEFMEKEPVIDTGYKDIDLAPIYKALKKGIKGKFLADMLPFHIAEKIERFARNYTFGEMITSEYEYGLHNRKRAEISLNLQAIGNNPNKFVETLVHELRHAWQHRILLQITKKSRDTWTDKEKSFVDSYRECKKANKERQEYYDEHKDIIDKFANNKFYSEEERINAIKQLLIEEQNIIIRYDELFDNYLCAEWETDARAEGVKDATGYKRKSEFGLSKNAGTLQTNNGMSKKRHLGTNSRNGSSEASIGISGYKKREEVKSKNDVSTSDEINQAIRNKVYKWHGDINSDRYDVDKSLNSFVNLTKSRAKDLSKKTGIKISDKQLREIMPFLRERTEFPKTLEREDLRKIFNSLTKSDKTELTRFADSIADKFEKYYDYYKVAKGTPDAESLENHISHIWDLDNKKKSLLTNYITTNSRFAKQRTIGTLIEGIDGIEINGETVRFKPKTLDYAEILKTSSDNLIKATHDSALAYEIKNLKHDGEPLVLPANKAPSDWVEINHPALSKVVYKGSVGEDNLPVLMKTPVKVHPEIADYVSSIFEVQKSSKAWDVYDSLNGMIKQALLGFSGFHGYALSESAVGNMGLKGTLSELNPKKFIDAIKNGKYDIYEKEPLAKRAIKAGVQLGTPSDLNRNLVEDTLKKIPVVGKIIASGVSANNKILWDVLHNNYKIMAFNSEIERLEQKGKITPEQERAVAQWVNDSFGGQAWELLGIKKSAIKTAGRILLSPDWNFSTIRQFAGSLNNAKFDKYLNDKKAAKRIANLSGISENIKSDGIRGRKARAFWLSSAIIFGVFYNLINAAFREKDRKEHPELYPKNMTPYDYSIWANSYPMDSAYDKLMPKVFIGRNSNGTSRMLRVGKQFREVPEMLSEPIEKLGGKTSPIVNISSQVGLGMSPADTVKKVTGKEAYLSQDIWDGYGPDAKMKTGKDAVVGRTKALGKSLVPFIGSKYIGGKHEFSTWDFVAQTNAGATKGKVYRQAKAAFETGNSDEIRNIKQQAYKDGLRKEDINKMVGYAEKNYKAENTKKYRGQFLTALKNKDKKALNKIKTDMENHKLPAVEQRRIYKSAWEKFLKESR